MTTATLNGVALATACPEADIVRVRRPFTVPRHTAVTVPGRAGSIIFPDEPGDRTVTLELHISAADFAARRTAVAALMAWAYTGTVTSLTIDDQTDRYETAILDASVDPDEWLTHTGVIALPFRCGAYALAATASVENFTASTNPDDGTFTTGGNVDARPVIELTPAGGTITGFTLTVNGLALTWAGTATTSPITVNSIAEVVLAGLSADVNLTGAYDPTSARMADVSGLFPVITSGVNTWALTWTGTATSVAINIEWRERFLT